MTDADSVAHQEWEGREVQAAESRIEFALAGAFTLLLAGTLYYVYTLFEPLVPAGRLHAWVGFMATITVIMVVVPLIVFLRQPDTDEIVEVWDRVGKGVAVLYDLAVASSVWLLLPYASEPLQLLMVIFYSAAISGQVISTAESTDTIVFGVVVIFGSAALFFLMSGSIYSGSLAVFLLAFGGMLIAVSLVLKHAIRTAIRMRLKAEKISEELAIALEEAREARDARTRFIAAASHDLRQPLQAAMLFFQQLLRNPPESQRRRAEEGVRQGFSEANSLLDRMLEHLRLESGTLAVNLEPVALGPMFAALVAETLPAARHAGLDLRAQRTNLIVHADRSLLSRCLRNLLHNAVVHARARRVRMLARRRGGDVEIFVLDDGTGIAPELAADVFAPYTQGPAARVGGRGMGLGLAAAAELARHMLGELSLESRWKLGAGFRLTLPLATGLDREESRVEVPETADGCDLEGLHLLVVDDDMAAGQALASLLTQLGADVRLAAAESEVLDLLEGWLPDAVVCDWHLGNGVTAMEVIARLRGRCPGLPAVVMTGDGSRETLLELDELGLPVLWKPVDMSVLLRTITSLTES